MSAVEMLKKQEATIKKKYSVKKIGVFGSAIRDDFKEGSDIDVLAEFDSPVGFFDFIRLENFLSGILNRKVDLISRKALKPAIKDEILKETIYV